MVEWRQEVNDGGRLVPPQVDAFCQFLGGECSSLAASPLRVMRPSPHSPTPPPARRLPPVYYP